MEDERPPRYLSVKFDTPELQEPDQRTGRAPWRRILYEKQAYKDNHYDPCKFFEQLTVLRHEEFHNYTFFQAVWNASLLVQQYSAVTFFLTVYQFLVAKQLALLHLRVLNIFAVATGSLVYWWLEGKHHVFGEFLRVSILFWLCLRLAAPVIRTLTSAVSEDTIYATAILLSVVHLVFHEHHPTGSRTTAVPETASIISLNTALFTGIILASRLDSAETVVAFVSFAVVSFTLFPLICRLLRAHVPTLHVCFAILQWLCTTLAVAGLAMRDGAVFLALYEVLVLFLWVLGPALFLHLLRFKRVLRGPWDLAVVP